MNKYLVTLRLKGQLIKTAVFADSSTHARLLGMSLGDFDLLSA